jgi:hypothetical protein
MCPRHSFRPSLYPRVDAELCARRKRCWYLSRILICSVRDREMGEFEIVVHRKAEPGNWAEESIFIAYLSDIVVITSVSHPTRDWWTRYTEHAQQANPNCPLTIYWLATWVPYLYKTIIVAGYAVKYWQKKSKIVDLGVTLANLDDICASLLLSHFAAHCKIEGLLGGKRLAQFYDIREEINHVFATCHWFVNDL